MHDIKLIRKNPEPFVEGWNKRGLDGKALVEEIIGLDKSERGGKNQEQELKTRQNEITAKIKEAVASGGKLPAELLEESKQIKAELAALKDGDGAAEGGDESSGAVFEKLAALPNLPAADVPQGEDEEDNVEVRSWGEQTKFSFTAKEHFDIGEALGMMSFEDAAKLSGARFVVLKDKLAKLERALASFFLDTLTEEFGYTETIPPFLVRDNAVFGTGQLPKFSEDLFKTTNDFWLIPTAEVPLTNLAADTIFEEDAFPMRYAAYTPCFRSEAGSAGKDTRGMIRQHQFTKVEMVSIAHPDQSEEEHERMTKCAETMLQRLNLPYRVMLLCSQDMGFGAVKTYDIEVWLPGQGKYREISSCSNCGPFQALRMKARFKREGGKGTEPVHTLNGSGLPIGRTMVAIIENYQNEDGSITVPEVLRPYMRGLEKITG